MGFRSVLRRSARPAAMVGVVGILSLSLVVSTPSNAHAFSNGDDLLKAAPRIAGAVKTIAPVAGPVLAVATSVTPMGWVLKGGYSLAMLAFSTSDVWMPWLLEQGSTWGQGSNPNDVPAGPSSNGWIDPNVSIGSVTVSSSNLYTASIVVNTVAPSHTSGVNFFVSTYLECNSKQDGTGTKYGPYRWTPNSSYGPTWGRQLTLSPACDQGFLTGIIAGPTYGAPELTQAAGAGLGPKNVVRWGTLAGTGSVGGFDPNSPNVGYQGQSECIDGTGTISWISGPVISGEAGGVQMPSCEAAGKGHGTGRTKVIAFKPDGTQQPVWDVPVAPSDPSTPMCDPGRATGGCVLSVELDGKGCEAGNVECENWSELQKNEPNNTRLKCRFGPYTLPMSACNLLEQAYRAGGALATERNTDGDPSTQDNNNYAGQPVPQPAPGPVAAPGPGGVPGGAGQLGPQAQPEQKQCFPQGWGLLNPVEWVMKPVGCALSAAFQPTTPVQTRITTMQAKFTNKAPVSWFGGDIVNVSGGSCPTNWAITVAGERVSLICGTPAEGIILAFRPVMGAMLVIAALWPLVRSLFYSSIPILKVNPS